MTRIHYAWWIVTGSVVIEFFGLGFGIFALTASYPYWEHAFGWSRTAVVGSMTVVVTTVAALSPLVGWLLDRGSVRRLFVLGSLVQALGLLALSRAQSLPAYYASSFLLGTGMSCVTVMPNQVLLARWFHARLGLVNGLITAGTVLGGSASPVVFSFLAERVGFQTAFRLLTLVVGTIPPLVTLLVIRDRPSDMGIGPFGEDATAGAPGPSPPGALAEAWRHRRTWVLATALFLGSWPCYAATKHIILYLRDQGIAQEPAAAVLSSMLFAAFLGRLLFGVLWDYVSPRTILVADYVLLALGAVILFLARSPEARRLYIVVFGLGYGGLMPLVPLTVVAYFGRRAMGAILGSFKLFYDTAAGLAPLVTAWLYDRDGNYQLAFAVNALLPMIALAMIVLLTGPPPRVREP